MRRCRPVRPLLHSAAVELCLRRARHHGHPHHPGSARTPDHDHGCTTDDLLGAAAGVCSDDRRLHPAAKVYGLFNLQGLVLFALYVAGIVSAPWHCLDDEAARRRDKDEHPLIAGTAKRTACRIRATCCAACGNARWIFLRRVGGIILALTVLLWFLLSFPAAPVDATHAGHRLQLRRPHRPCDDRHVRAARLQLADLHRADPGAWRRAKWRCPHWPRSTRCPPSTTRPPRRP
jgi:hypothetical protein